MAAPSAEKDDKTFEKVRGGGGRAESLGWLAESTVMPKKHKAIEGVGAASIVELKAQLYRTQEEARKSKDSDPSSSSSSAADALRARKRSAAPPDLFSQKNSGVECRAHKYSSSSLSHPLSSFSYRLD
jgi:hypothetical protein